MKSNITFKNFVKHLKFYFKNYWYKFLIISFLLTLDLVTKALIVPQNQEIWQDVEIIKDIIVISPTRNIGAGFSILQGKTWLLISLTIIFILVLTIFDIFYKKKSKLYGISTAIIFTGAIGNLIDRISFGYVRDFIYLKFINFPVFNVADMALTIGIILLLIYIIFYAGKVKENDIESQQLEINKTSENAHEFNYDAKDAKIQKNTYNTGISSVLEQNENVNKSNVNDNNSQIKNGENNAKDNNWRWYW